MPWLLTDWPLLLQSTGLADNTEAISATLVANGFNYSGKDFITSGITGAGRPACAPPACTPPACTPVGKVWEQSDARRPDQCHLCSLACVSRAGALQRSDHDNINLQVKLCTRTNSPLLLFGASLADLLHHTSQLGKIYSHIMARLQWGPWKPACARCLCTCSASTI